MGKEKEVLANEEQQVEEEVIVTEEETAVVEDVEKKETDEPVVEEQEELSVEERIKKAVQSASSKAKNEILKEIGIESVADIKAQIEKGGKYEATVLQVEELNKQIEEFTKEREATASEIEALRNKAKATEDSLLVHKLGVSEEFADDFIKLVDLDTSGNERLAVAEALKERFTSGNIFKGVETPVSSVKIGNPKTEVEPTLKDRIKEMTKL